MYIKSCYQSIQEIDDVLGYTCNSNVDLSRTNGLTFETTSTGYMYAISICKKGYSNVLENAGSRYQSYCIKSDIQGSLMEITEIRNNVERNYVIACTNGYPNEDLTACILRGSAEFYEPSRKLLGQGISPMNQNCVDGTRKMGGRVNCQRCKEGWVANNSSETVQGQCFKLQTPVQGCMIGRDQKCTVCDIFEGWLPTDSQVTSCYKF